MAVLLDSWNNLILPKLPGSKEVGRGFNSDIKQTANALTRASMAPSLYQWQTSHRLSSPPDPFPDTFKESTFRPERELWFVV